MLSKNQLIYLYFRIKVIYCFIYDIRFQPARLLLNQIIPRKCNGKLKKGLRNMTVTLAYLKNP